MFQSKKKLKIIEQLEFLGYDSFCIKEVMKSHNKFEPALKALNEKIFFKSKLDTLGIPKCIIKTLAEKFISVEDAKNYYYHYKANEELKTKDKLTEMGFPLDIVVNSINNLLTLDDFFSSPIWKEEESKEYPSLENLIKSLRAQPGFTELPQEDSKECDSRQISIEPNEYSLGEEPSFDFIVKNLNNSNLKISIGRNSLGMNFEESMERINSLRSRRSGSMQNDQSFRPTSSDSISLLADYINSQSVSFDEIIRVVGSVFKQSGLDKEIIDELKRETLSDLGQVRDKNCAVCLFDYKLNDEVITLCCSHIFHSNCIVPWLENSVICPLCKVDLSSNMKI